MPMRIYRFVANVGIRVKTPRVCQCLNIRDFSFLCQQSVDIFRRENHSWKYKFLKRVPSKNKEQKEGGIHIDG
jgi:hypothetical protein